MTTLTVKDGDGNDQTLAVYDTGSGYAVLHALSNASGTQINPATLERQTSVQASAGSVASLAVAVQGITNGVSVRTNEVPKSSAGSLTNHRAWSAATVNSTSVKTSSGTIYSGFIENFDSSVIYVKFYDSAAAPTVGTAIPVLTVHVDSTSSLSLNDVVGASGGLYFANGIAYGITGAYSDSDTTTVSASTALIQFQYA